jgi:DNA-binding transcriptional LysR family regulator
MDQLRAFLTLSEELHFGHTAERLYLSQSRVSRLIASFEAELGAPLFERTSRRVRPTPLGGLLARQLRPAYDAMIEALETATADVRATSGALRIGTPQTVDSPFLFQIINAHRKTHPHCTVSVIETDVWDPYTPLRDGDIDILYNWLAVDEPDLATSPAVEERARVLAVSTRHPLAARTALSLEDLAAFRVNRHPAEFPDALSEAIAPPRTPAGRTIPRSEETARSPVEILALVLSGQVVVPTVPTAPRWRGRPDIRLIAITDLPPLPLGLIWCNTRENARIRAFAQTAAAVTTLDSERSQASARARASRAR